MQNRKDLLQAHRLMTQRAALALLQAEPDPPDRPLRRLNVGMFSSVLVAVIVLAVFGIWGWIDPGNAQGLNAPGTLIMDSQTGTSYVWCENGKRLCPVVNYASARLALNTSSPNQVTVSQASLANYPRGPEIGIPGLPQALPESSRLISSPWSVCAQSVSNPGVIQPRTVTTLVGGHRVGGRALSTDQALLVQASGTSGAAAAEWLIWNGERLPIQASTQRSALAALNTTQQPATMPLAWLNAFSQGPAFAPPAIAHPGKAVTAPQIGSAVAGQVFTTSAGTGASRQFYVMLSSGKLEKVTPTQAELLIAAAPDGVSQRTIALATAATDSVSAAMPSGGLPDTMPTVVSYTPTNALCVVYTGSATVAPPGPQVTVGGTVPAYAQPTNGSAGVNQVALPPGTGALVGVVAGAQDGQSPVVSNYYLVTGGLRYGLASQSVAGVLGYTLPGQRTLLPAWVADLVPLGTPLDPNNARQQVQNLCKFLATVHLDNRLDTGNSPGRWRMGSRGRVGWFRTGTRSCVLVDTSAWSLLDDFLTLPVTRPADFRLPGGMTPGGTTGDFTDSHAQ
jgi:type VII secretion protein EccB